MKSSKMINKVLNKMDGEGYRRLVFIAWLIYGFLILIGFALVIFMRVGK